MVLIIGGAYQGKLSYVLKEYSKKASDVYDCSVECSAAPPNLKIIYHFERWILTCVRVNPNPESVIAEYLKTLTDEIIVCEDISCGLVPVDQELRMWRETVGRTLTVLSVRADRVVRLFCGIPTILKGE